MTYLVTDNCVNCKYTECVDSCPVDCFHQGPNFVSIDPDECIDCGVCVSRCPVNAIVYEYDIIDKDEREFWSRTNKEISRNFPRITVKQKPFLYHEYWINQTNKRFWIKRK